MMIITKLKPSSSPYYMNERLGTLGEQILSHMTGPIETLTTSLASRAK